ncbi:MAG: hypothetical protein KDC18_17385 [Alphaproteobacteria bacterium]|nr:hypothetical protein [Alphaproteobacteria bacterium]MCB9928876.1 hypothetical protein [Alphaproteobacteria bacterium]
MTRVNLLKTNFTAGEISPLLFGRGDLRAYDNGAAALRNVFIHPTGGVQRRPGLRYVATARGPGRLVSFEFNTEQTYLLAFSDGMLDVYDDGVLTASVATPWSAAHLPQMAWTQSADTLLVTHPEVEPRRITRTGPGSWSIDTWPFAAGGDLRFHPYYRFAAAAVTLTPSDVTGVVTLAASAAVFDAAHAGQTWRVAGKQVRIDAVASATEATATVLEDLPAADPTPDFEEPAFSSLRGWPVTVAFHQDRLVIGGSRDLPNRLWLSKAGDLFNFDLGEGLDDEGIEFPILSDQVNAIRGVFSGRHLQVFTSGAEWMVTGDPLTPTSVQVRRQTRIGSVVSRHIPPKNVDGATLFIGRTGRELREFLFADIEQVYQAADLALLARHFFRQPVAQDFDPERRLLHVVLADGSLATLTVYRAEQVTAWSRQETEGAFRDIAVVGEQTYVAVEREHGLFLETFDEALGVDSGEVRRFYAPATQVDYLDRLEGQTVTIVADGTARSDAVVAGGTVPVGAGSTEIAIGLPFRHVIEALPVAANFPRGPAQGAAYRLVEVTFRLHETGALVVDLGDGAKPTPFRQVGGNMTFGAPTPNFSGDKRLRALGWRRAGIDRPWRIEQAAPVPCTVLSVSTELKVTD